MIEMPEATTIADRDIIRPFEEAGATWWIEEIFTSRGSLKKIGARIAARPPRG